MRARVLVLTVLLISLGRVDAQQASEANSAGSGESSADAKPATVRSPERARRGRHEDSNITVRVYDFARLDRPVLVNTTRQAGRIFRKAGVATNWLICSRFDPPMPDECNASISPTDLVLRIVRRPHPPKPDSGLTRCGVALEDQDGRGS